MKQMFLYDDHTRMCLGQIGRYSESGDSFLVRLVGISKCNYGNSLGVEYLLEMLRVEEANGRVLVPVGEVRSVWAANDSHGYSVFRLEKARGFN